MNNPIPQCATDSPEWAFRAVEIINDLQRRCDNLAVEHAALLIKHNALRSSIEWWIECSEGYDEHGWGFWLDDDATEELSATCNAAWTEVERTLEKTK